MSNNVLHLRPEIVRHYRELFFKNIKELVPDVEIFYGYANQSFVVNDSDLALLKLTIKHFDLYVYTKKGQPCPIKK